MSDCFNQCPHLGRIAKLETQYDHVTPLINKLDGKLDQVILSLGRVEVLESKHNNHAESLARAFDRIGLIERQSLDTARALADLLSQIKGMTRMGIILWTAMGSAVGFILTRVLA